MQLVYHVVWQIPQVYIPQKYRQRFGLWTRYTHFPLILHPFEKYARLVEFFR